MGRFERPCGSAGSGLSVAHEPRRRVRRGGLPVLLAAGAFVNIGTFAVYPYLTILLRERLDVGIAQVGAVLGAAMLVQFAGAPFTAAFSERVGLKRSLVLSTVLYTAGALTYLLGAHRPVLTVVALFLSCGAGALYSPAFRAYLVHAVDPDRRSVAVSAGNASSNLGIALGPVLGALLLFRPDLLFTTTTALFAVLVLVHVLLRPEQHGGDERPTEPIRRVLHGFARLPFAVTVVTHYLYMQFYQYLSIYTHGRLTTAAYGLIMMGYSLGLVVLQPLVARWVGRIGYPTATAIGFSCMAAGMAAFAADGPAGIVAGVAVMSVGNAILFLKNDVEALARSSRSATVTFGQQRLAVGVGTLLSGVVGGSVYGLFEQAGMLAGFWLTVAAQCVALPVAVMAGWHLISADGRDAGERTAPDSVRTAP